MVPPAEFQSYYGRPILKAPVWTHDIPAYLFTGGLAAGSSLLAAGGDLTGRPQLRRAGRLDGARRARLASTGLLVNDLGRPERFLHMLRVAKPTSPMSVGTWILAAYGGAAAGAGAAEVARAVDPRGPVLRPLARSSPGPASGRPGRGRACTGAGDVHRGAARRHRRAVLARGLPAAAVRVRRQRAGQRRRGRSDRAPADREAGPARRLAVVGAAMELARARAGATTTSGLLSEPYPPGGRDGCCTPVQVLDVARRGRCPARGAGAGRCACCPALACWPRSAVTRFGIFEGGVASAEDPKYVVVPQRGRLEGRGQTTSTVTPSDRGSKSSPITG